MDANSQDWAQLEYLSGHISKLQSHCEAARGMKHFGAVKAIEREIAETAAQRERLVILLRNRLANQVSAPLATPAEARI
jgi:hypothetical protein